MKTSDSEIGFLRKQGTGRLCPLESANAIPEAAEPMDGLEKPSNSLLR